jgi:rhodanese-related sulfurtransferase/uncharacterized damage-inducible protein DinB/DNA-directed RNA polymerase subunit RPC12/RpoP
MQHFINTFKAILLPGIFFLTLSSSHIPTKYVASPGSDEEYVCSPCGQDCDNTVYHSPGTCPNCNMPLVKKSTVHITNIQPTEICSYIASHPGVVLLDVRTKEEFEGKVNPEFGALKGAINIPIQDLEKKMPTIENLKNKEIIVYCSHSHRSPGATYMLMQHGFTNVKNMAGGMSVMKDNACRLSFLPEKLPDGSLAPGVKRLLNNIENGIIMLAQKMPEDKFNFTPESLNISGSSFKDVRTFAGQVKHLATDNYHIWSAITGDPLPPGVHEGDVNGPASMTSKEDIMKFLTESFKLGHKAMDGLTDKNALDMISFRGGKLPRLDLMWYALTHDQDHYGQMVVYLRMCGITP